MDETNPHHNWMHAAWHISGKLFISMPTVKMHVAHVLSKIHARNRVQAVVFAYDNHLV